MDDLGPLKEFYFVVRAEAPFVWSALKGDRSRFAGLDHPGVLRRLHIGVSPQISDSRGDVAEVSKFYNQRTLLLVLLKRLSTRSRMRSRLDEERAQGLWLPRPFNTSADERRAINALDLSWRKLYGGAIPKELLFIVSTFIVESNQQSDDNDLFATLSRAMRNDNAVASDLASIDWLINKIEEYVRREGIDSTLQANMGCVALTLASHMALYAPAELSQRTQLIESVANVATKKFVGFDSDGRVFEIQVPITKYAWMFLTNLASKPEGCRRVCQIRSVIGTLCRGLVNLGPATRKEAMCCLNNLAFYEEGALEILTEGILDFFFHVNLKDGLDPGDACPSVVRNLLMNWPKWNEHFTILEKERFAQSLVNIMQNPNDPLLILAVGSTLEESAKPRDTTPLMRVLMNFMTELDQCVQEIERGREIPLNYLDACRSVLNGLFGLAQGANREDLLRGGGIEKLLNDILAVCLKSDVADCIVQDLFWVAACYPEKLLHWVRLCATSRLLKVESFWYFAFSVMRFSLARSADERYNTMFNLATGEWNELAYSGLLNETVSIISIELGVPGFSRFLDSLVGSAKSTHSNVIDFIVDIATLEAKRSALKLLRFAGSQIHAQARDTIRRARIEDKIAKIYREQEQAERDKAIWLLRPQKVETKELNNLPRPQDLVEYGLLRMNEPKPIDSLVSSGTGADPSHGVFIDDTVTEEKLRPLKLALGEVEKSLRKAITLLAINMDGSRISQSHLSFKKFRWNGMERSFDWDAREYSRAFDAIMDIPAGGVIIFVMHGLGTTSEIISQYLLSWQTDRRLYGEFKKVHVVNVEWEGSLSSSTSMFGSLFKGLFNGDVRFVRNCVERSKCVGRALKSLADAKADDESKTNLKSEFGIVSHSFGTHGAHYFVQNVKIAPRFNVMFNPHLYKESLITQEVPLRAPTIVVVNSGDTALSASAFLVKTSLGRIASPSPLFSRVFDQKLVQAVLVAEGCQVIVVRSAEARSYGDSQRHHAYKNPSLKDVLFELLSNYKPQPIVQSRCARFTAFAKTEQDSPWFTCTLLREKFTGYERDALQRYLQDFQHRYNHRCRAAPLVTVCLPAEDSTGSERPSYVLRDYSFRAENVRFHACVWSSVFHDLASESLNGDL